MTLVIQLTPSKPRYSTMQIYEVDTLAAIGGKVTTSTYGQSDSTTVYSTDESITKTNKLSTEANTQTTTSSLSSVASAPTVTLSLSSTKSNVTQIARKGLVTTTTTTTSNYTSSTTNIALVRNHSSFSTIELSSNETIR